MKSVRAVVEDISATVRDYASSAQASPNRLEEVEDRLELLNRLKRKYGPSLEQVMAHGQEVAAKLAEVENRDQLLLELRAAQTRAADAYRLAASALTAERTAAAAKLEKLAVAHINDLAMKANLRCRSRRRTRNLIGPGKDGMKWIAGSQPMPGSR